MNEAVYGQADLAFQSNLYQSGNATRRWIHQRRHEWVIRKLYEYSPGRGMLAFDCGVGCGVYTEKLVKMGVRVVGIDVNQEFVAAAGKMPGVLAYTADICAPETVPVRSEAGIAVCSEVLEHVPDPDTALKTLYDTLKPGGILVLTTPQKWSTTELVARLLKVKAIEAIARKIYKEPVEELGHISLLTQGDLQRRIEATGFEVVEHEVFAFYLPVIAEFGGEWGQRVLAGVEKVLRRVPFLKWMVWTQAYVLKKR